MDKAPESQHEAKQSRGWFSLIVRVLLVVVVLGWWFAYLISSRFWIADVAVSLGWIVFAIALVLGAVGLLLRRSLDEVICTLAALMMLDVLGGGRSWVPSDGDEGAANAVRVVEMNIYMANERPDEVLALLRTMDADVMVLVEPQWDVFRRFIDDEDGLDWLPYRMIRRRIGKVASPMVVLSRWSIERDESLTELYGMSCVVRRPEELGGAFRLVGMHAPSPRGGEEWSRGNGIVESLVSSLRGIEQRDPDELALMVVGDLNGGAGSWRDRRLREGLGVARGSSVLELSGTFPAKLSMMGVGIDDIWVDEGVVVRSWERMVIPGSDHFGFRADVLIGGAESALSGAGAD
jgi:endonuclease/exonuclease/phosphatase (EEP) superfamily protein YafD